MSGLTQAKMSTFKISLSQRGYGIKNHSLISRDVRCFCAFLEVGH